MPAGSLAAAYLLVPKLSAPLAWARFVWTAYRHGRAAPPLSCFDWEALFPLPLAEARRRIGVASAEEVHAGRWPEKGRWLERIERGIQKGPRTGPVLRHRA